MYGISYRLVSDVVSWHPDVEVYDVYEGERRLGRIYLDQFPREDKYKHYMTAALAFGKKGVEVPEVVLVCNFPRPGKEPALMEYSDVITFFHEYGHLLDNIFSGQNRWLGRPDREIDFIETASELLEEWARDPAILQSFARHHQTNEPILSEMVQKMRRANEFGKGLMLRTDLALAAASLRYYDGDPKGLDTDAVMAEAYKYLPFKYVDGTHLQTQLVSLDGYSAAYYTYMWSGVMAKDAFSVFREKGLLDRDTAARFRRSVLDSRGTRPAADQMQEFLGRPYSIKAFEDWLNSN
jgi:thimet oligopeptidase